MARVLIGTSGWHYDSWKGPFYPDRLSAARQLEFYATQFQSTELNGVFYRTPTPAAVTGWHQQTGPDFVFAWKASKFITHWKRLSEDCASSLALLESRVQLLGPKLGPILFQLPPKFAVDAQRLGRFCTLLAGHHRYAMEFRHPSWYSAPVFRLLAEYNIALCISDHHEAPAPWRRTADFVYVRGHGPAGDYKDHYSPATLKSWDKRIRGWARRGYDVYVYFDNDQKSCAPADAMKLQSYAPRQRARGATAPKRGRSA